MKLNNFQSMPLTEDDVAALMEGEVPDQHSYISRVFLDSLVAIGEHDPECKEYAEAIFFYENRDPDGRDFVESETLSQSDGKKNWELLLEFEALWKQITAPNFIGGSLIVFRDGQLERLDFGVNK